MVHGQSKLPIKILSAGSKQNVASYNVIGCSRGRNQLLNPLCLQEKCPLSGNEIDHNSGTLP